MIARKKELKILNNACDSTKSSLIAIYGRRRIGKTYLVDYMFKTHRNDCIYFEYTGSYEISKEIQIENFIEQIYEWFRVEPQNEIKNWSAAFRFLKRAIVAEQSKYDENKKITIFLDEVPWIDKSNSDGFLSALGYFWNTYCEKHNNCIVILCGSNASWIQNRVLDDSEGPLYKRITDKIAMKPFDLKETKEYLLYEMGFDIDDRLVSEIYMVIGGVAKYLSYLKSEMSIYDNIDNLFFNIDGILYNEYDVVFKSLFGQRGSIHKTIMNALSNSSQDKTILGLTASIKTASRGTIDSAIDELILCGFIKGIKKYGNKTKGTSYIVADSLCNFHNRWLKEKSKNDMANLTLPFWGNIASKQAYHVWTGFCFESICINNVHLYTAFRQLQGMVENVSYWNYIDKEKQGNGTQIDMIVEYSNNVFDIVECKYYDDEYVISDEYAKKLINKKTQFREHGLKASKRSDLRVVMLTTFGCKKNSGYNTAKISADVTLSDLLES